MTRAGFLVMQDVNYQLFSDSVGKRHYWDLMGWMTLCVTDAMLCYETSTYWIPCSATR